jgi:hypothetical protein
MIEDAPGAVDGTPMVDGMPRVLVGVAH